MIDLAPQRRGSAARRALASLALALLLCHVVVGRAAPAPVVRQASAAKFDRVERFRGRLKAELRPWIDQRLARPHADRQTAVAAILETMRQTGARVGSQAYANRKAGFGKDGKAVPPPTLGIGTLRNGRADHGGSVEAIGVDFVRLSFIGKQQKRWEVTLHGRALAEAYRQFYDPQASGPLFPANGRHTLALLKRYDGWNHAFRYLKAADVLERELAARPRPRDRAAAQCNLQGALEVVARELRHSDPRTSMGYYIDQRRAAAYVDAAGRSASER